MLGQWKDFVKDADYDAFNIKGEFQTVQWFWSLQIPNALVLFYPPFNSCYTYKYRAYSEVAN